METLKLISIRLEKTSLDKVDYVANSLSYIQKSGVIRIALWAGLKIVNSRNFLELSRLQYEEELKEEEKQLDIVLRTAGLTKEEGK